MQDLVVNKEHKKICELANCLKEILNSEAFGDFIDGWSYAVKIAEADDKKKREARRRDDEEEEYRRKHSDD